LIFGIQTVRSNQMTNDKWEMTNIKSQISNRKYQLTEP